MIPQFILPTNVRLKANAINTNTGVLTIIVSALQTKSSCPICKIKSSKVHSKYKRTLTDLPVSGYVAKIELIARRYFCGNPSCHRKVFTERFDNEIRPYNRRLLRSNDLLGRMALELGGNGGSKISHLVGIPVAPSTVLRIIKRIDIKTVKVTSGVIGIDDWALKKGQTYGTAIVDLERRQVIDLLPDRESETLATWLRKHPEVTTVSRDRYRPYALGIRNGAPEARQVADRFHLIMNLGTATKRIIQSKGKELKAAFKHYNNRERECAVIPIPEPENPGNVESINLDDNPTRQYQFKKVKELHLQNYSARSISRIMNMSRETIKKYIQMDQLYKRESRYTLNFNDFQAVLLNEDNKRKTYKELHLLITEMGFNGKYTQFCHRMNRLNNIPPGTRRVISNERSPVLTWLPSQLAKLLYLEQNEIAKKEDKDFLNYLYGFCPAIKQLEVMIKKFKKMFIEKQDGLLKAWITEASRPESLLKNFAKGLNDDFEAVNNAVITGYSNGQLEGQVNRIKNIKRKMYGRASFQLLRTMVLIKSEAFHQN